MDESLVSKQDQVKAFQIVSNAYRKHNPTSAFQIVSNTNRKYHPASSLQFPLSSIAMGLEAGCEI
jgi:hypothetical protein